MRPALFRLTVLPMLAAAVVIALVAMAEAPEVARYAVVLLLSYLVGSIPWGYIMLYWQRGVDIREYGSGRTGTSNVLRTAGGKIALVVLLLDLGKGILPVLLARALIGTKTGEVAAGLLALIGHDWPVFLRFCGGRGIATGLGGLFVMAPIPAAIGAIAFIPITLLSRYLSLGSITGVIFACFSLLALTLLGMYSSTYAVYAFLGGAIIIWQHRDNIQRIIQGNERRLGHPAGKVG